VIENIVLNQIFREHLNQMDIKEGGGIVTNSNRVDALENPALIIGLGGTGIDALLKVKYQMSRRFVLPEDPVTNKKMEKPNTIEFLALDTDVASLSKSEFGIKLNERSEFHALTHAGIGRYIKERNQVPSYITDWLSPELTLSDGTNGAEGFRQAGRLLLFLKLSSIIESITRKINSLITGNDKKLYVFILSGISGGTGSGTFLDIAYIIRQILENKSKNLSENCEMLGYMFTPDVNMHRPSVKQETRDYIMRNGYAALKELDYWMNVDERQGESFVQQYGGLLTVNQSCAPFNRCMLVSATNADGMVLEDGYNYCMDAVAENITNFMASEDVAENDVISIQSYFSNAEQNKGGIHKHIDYQANFSYYVLGASTAVLPVEDMTAYLAYRLFQKMGNMFEVSPDYDDVKALTRKVRMDYESLLEDFEQQSAEFIVPGWQTSRIYSYEQLIARDPDRKVFETDRKEYFLVPSKANYAKYFKQSIGTYYDRLMERLDEMFGDSKYGPLYAALMIQADNKTSACLANQIDIYKKQVEEHIMVLEKGLKELEIRTIEKHEEAARAWVFKDKKRDEYVQTSSDEWYTKARIEALKVMRDFYSEFDRRLSDLYASKYTKIYNSIWYMKKIFDNNGEGLERGIGLHQSKYFWHLISLQEIEKIVERELETKDPDILIERFSQKIKDDLEKWTDDIEIDITTSFGNFIDDNFDGMVNKPLEEYLVIARKGATIDSIIKNEIAKKLNDLAKENFHLDNVTDGFNFPHIGYLSIPRNAPEILKAVKEYNDSSNQHKTFSIKRSRLTNRIFWLNTMLGIPLFSYAPIKEYEKKYEEQVFDKGGVARHLVMNSNNNWVNLPSPIPEEKWGQFYSNERIKQINDEARALFAESLQYKVIRQKDTEDSTSKYEIVLGDDFVLESYMEQQNIRLSDEEYTLYTVQQAIDNLQGLLNNGLTVSQRYNIFSSKNETNARINFSRMPEKIRLVRTELVKYRAISAEIARLSELKTKLEKAEKFIDLLVEVLVTNTIKLDEQEVFYVYDYDSTKENVWSPIHNTNERVMLLEYAIYDKLQKLEDEKIQRLVEVSDERRDTMGKAYSNNLEQLHVRATSAKKRIESEKLTHTPEYLFVSNLMKRTKPNL
jgi:hypothetical protein